jgi:hypothetical protein
MSRSGVPQYRPVSIDPTQVAALSPSAGTVRTPQPLASTAARTVSSLARGPSSPVLTRLNTTVGNSSPAMPPEFGPVVQLTPTSRAPSIRHAKERALEISGTQRFQEAVKRVLSNRTLQPPNGPEPPAPEVRLPSPIQNAANSFRVGTVSPVTRANSSVVVQHPQEIPYSRQPCPFLPSDEQVEAMFEVESVNYAVYEGLKQRRPDLARLFDAVVMRAMQRLLADPGGVVIEPANIWTEVRPGLLGSAILRFEDNREQQPYIADAEWPMRIRTVIRCLPCDTTVIVSALQWIGQGDVTMDEPFDVYHKVQSTVVGPCNLRLVDHNAPESSVDGVRHPSPRRQVQQTSPSHQQSAPYSSPPRAVQFSPQQQHREYLQSYSPAGLNQYHQQGQMSGSREGSFERSYSVGEGYRFIRTR